MSKQQQQLPSFDLQAYISRYNPNSETHLQRLLYLAHYFHSSSSSNNDNHNDITRQAFELAVDQMKKCGNHRRYLEEYGAVVESSTTAGSGTSGGSSPTLNPLSINADPELTSGGTISSTTPPRNNNVNMTNTPNHNHHHTPMKHIITHYQNNYDGNFITQSKMTYQSMLDTLEGRLSTAQSHLMKESIRTALIALAEFHRDRGELREAWRRAARSR